MSATPTTAEPAQAPVAEREWALGPGAVSWKVLRNPAVFVIALLREGMLLTLHPQFASAAVDHDRVHSDPVLRYRTIARYAYSTVYGTPADAERVASFVRRNHSRVVGIEPITGLDYQAHSEYELSLTHTMLSQSWIAAYDFLHPEPLTRAERDQFLMEQKTAGALLGIPPEHLPSDSQELETYLGNARKRWAAGLQAREILRPFTMGDYPAGTVIANLPPLKRKPISRIIRGLSDMCMLTMHPEELELFSLPRKPELRSERAVRASAKLLAAAMGSERGTAAWDSFMKSDVAAIMRRAREAERAAGGHEVAARSFTPPDPAPLVVEIPGLVRNWRPEVFEPLAGDR